MKKCPNCGTKNADSAKQCNFCEAALPEAEMREAKKADYVHNSTAEKKKAKNRRITVIVACVVVIAALCGIAAVIFSNDKLTKNEETAKMITDAFKKGSKITGTLKGKTKDLSFSASFEKDSVLIALNGAEYDYVLISKNGMMLEKDRENDKKTVQVTKDMEAYKLYTTYLFMSEIVTSDKSLLRFDTKDIEKRIMPIIKAHLAPDYDNTFINDNFVSAVASLLMMLGNDPDIETYMGITLPNDVKNAEIPFNLSSYDLQNKILSQFKKSFKSQTDYDVINNRLKESKSMVKHSYLAEGTFKTENSKIVSASADIVYEGYAFTLTLSFE